jgi:diadenosine tetraphosphate (Ap4A) HIT family hydrolase
VVPMSRCRRFATVRFLVPEVSRTISGVRERLARDQSGGKHAPLQESSEGTVILESMRHLLDFADMNPNELAELGQILHKLVPAVKAATGVQRVYYLAVMERAPRFHLWLVPKENDGQRRGVAYLAQQPPRTATHAAAEQMALQIREHFEQP